MPGGLTNLGFIGNAFTALWWGVAQGAQLQNVKITMASSSNGNGHTGIRLGRGSTLGLADTRIEKGQVCCEKLTRGLYFQAQLTSR